MSDINADRAEPSAQRIKAAGPSRIVIAILVSAAAICVCGACLILVGPPLGDSLALAVVCTVRSVDVSGGVSQKCSDWAIDVVLNHTAEYNQCEATRETADPGTADDAIMLCLEEQGLGPPK